MALQISNSSAFSSKRIPLHYGLYDSLQQTQWRLTSTLDYGKLAGISLTLLLRTIKVLYVYIFFSFYFSAAPVAYISSWGQGLNLSWRCWPIPQPQQCLILNPLCQRRNSQMYFFLNKRFIEIYFTYYTTHTFKMYKYIFSLFTNVCNLYHSQF